MQSVPRTASLTCGMACAEFSEDVLHRSSCEWERPASTEAEFDDLNDMRNCASLVGPASLCALRLGVQSMNRASDLSETASYHNLAVELRVPCCCRRARAVRASISLLCLVPVGKALCTGQEQSNSAHGMPALEAPISQASGSRDMDSRHPSEGQDFKALSPAYAVQKHMPGQAARRMTYLLMWPAHQARVSTSFRIRKGG